ncbi:MAG: hypothetical protein AAF539_07815 [Planctomycetota bacterium]
MPDSLTIIEATSRLADIARTASALRGWRMIVEFASGSESTYLHINRGAVQPWYGLRISAHRPAYACSQDYQQLELSKLVSNDQFSRAREVTLQFIVSGTVVVANPHDVRAEIWRQEIIDADGVIVKTDDAQRWRWNGPLGLWQRMTSCDSDDSSNQPISSRSLPPVSTPRQPVRTLRAAAIRHRINQREKWAAELALQDSIETQMG